VPQRHVVVSVLGQESLHQSGDVQQNPRLEASVGDAQPVHLSALLYSYCTLHQLEVS
jgi:hypothetical protein